MRDVYLSLLIVCGVSVVSCDEAETIDSSSTPTAPERADETVSLSSSIFIRRVLPIFQAGKPSSCTECHLSGVELKDYIQPSQEKTFASLVKAGLVDTKNVDESKILKFIDRRPEKPNLVIENVRRQELEAFREWLRAAVKDPAVLKSGTAAGPVGPRIPIEVVRHARRDRVLASFMENVWTEVGRCAACHSPDRNKKQVAEHGKQVSWITLNDPQATMRYMLKSRLINASKPEKSLLLMKPTMQVEHGGGQKMVVGDRSYKQFRRFIDDYAAMVAGKYQTAKSLPKPSAELSVVTDIWFKITGVPAKYDKMLLQADLHHWRDGVWTKHRVATSDRPVFGKGKLWQHSLSLTARRGTKWAREIRRKRLPAGKYLVKIYIDQQGKLQKDFRSHLGENEFVGQVEFGSRWPVGYGRMTVVQFPEKQ